MMMQPRPCVAARSSSASADVADACSRPVYVTSPRGPDWPSLAVGGRSGLSHPCAIFRNRHGSVVHSA
ncbi:hypothetical protein Y032_0014g2228 [Ancylostoma ceylanicum]|uniref:Uncharacterized protein n=1 Tax=Ancylostoma ceylanicum TaxID=53326 RepID=A0A016V8F3_9BILA|nr:hypothetical protein Y032_0014g2228 [Ancylostoma ceylanicum]